ncbi:MAG: DsrE family protein [Acetobacteraceae bacterium]|nr:DsrE family protein [Acetobacteraceae bacterium]
MRARQEEEAAMQRGEDLVVPVKEEVPEVGEDLFERGDVVVVLSSDRLGEGDPGLGELLVRNLFYALAESVAAPRAVVLLNRAVLLASPGSPVLESLRLLEGQGVEVLCCSTSLEHYGVSGQAGTRADMYRILELLFEARKTIVFSPGQGGGGPGGRETEGHRCRSSRWGTG